MRITDDEYQLRLKFCRWLEQNAVRYSNCSFIATQPQQFPDVHCRLNGLEMAGFIHKGVGANSRMMIKSALFDKIETFQKANMHPDKCMPDVLIFFEKPDAYYMVNWDDIRNNARPLMSLPYRDGDDHEVGFIISPHECTVIKKEEHATN